MVARNSLDLSYATYNRISYRNRLSVILESSLAFAHHTYMYHNKKIPVKGNTSVKANG